VKIVALIKISSRSLIARILTLSYEVTEVGYIFVEVA
jgi:hypothetical protein